MKEPLLWFLVIGGILFTADHYLSEQPHQVVVNDEVRSRLDKLWQTQTGNPATAAELDSLVENWIGDEVLFREAKQLGLAQNDPIVRRRLVQKISFLVEDIAADGDQPAALQGYYQDNVDRYVLPIRYSFSQIFFADVAKTGELRRKLLKNMDWQSLGDVSMLDDSYVLKTTKEISSSLGREFSGQLAELKKNQWIGPITSSFGFHLVRLEQIATKEVIPLERIQKRVLADFHQAKTKAALESYTLGLREKYRVVYQ